MDFEVLAILFILFSVISSLVRKFQGRQRTSRRDERMVKSASAGLPTLPERPAPIPEWDFPEDQPTIDVEEEFRGIRGKRHISESEIGPEFREVIFESPTVESADEPEYRRVEINHLTTGIQETIPEPASTAKVKGASRGIRTSVGFLSFDRRSIRQAILYNEILGPPRGESMPW